MMRWTVHLKGDVPKIYRQAAVLLQDELYCFVGDSDHIDVHIFNTVSLCWRKLTPVTPGRGERHLEVPSCRWGHTAVLVEDTVFLWGGCCGWEYYDVLYAFDVDTHRWFKPRVSGTVPEARGYHSACVLGKAMFIHGGFTQMTSTNDMYKLDTSTMVWTLIETKATPPPASVCQSSNVIGTKMFVFGGERGVQYNNDIRVFDTETNLWLSTPSAQLSPEKRCYHSAFTYNGELYIFGGHDNNFQDLNDVWKFSPKTFSWKKVEPKGKEPCPMYSMCCCIVGDRIILFGGYKGNWNRADDLYILDLSPTLKTLCKLAFIQYGLDQSELPHNITWELAAEMPTCLGAGV